MHNVGVRTVIVTFICTADNTLSSHARHACAQSDKGMEPTYESFPLYSHSFPTGKRVDTDCNIEVYLTIFFFIDWYPLRTTHPMMALGLRVLSKSRQYLGRYAQRLSESKAQRTFPWRFSNIKWNLQSTRQWATLRKGSYSTMRFHPFTCEMHGTTKAWWKHAMR